MTKKISESRIRKVAENLEEILNEDYCIVDPTCHICSEDFLTGDEIEFINSGKIMFIDDMGEIKAAINNLDKSSHFYTAHVKCLRQSKNRIN